MACCAVRCARPARPSSALARGFEWSQVRKVALARRRGAGVPISGEGNRSPRRPCSSSSSLARILPDFALLLPKTHGPLTPATFPRQDARRSRHFTMAHGPLLFPTTLTSRPHDLIFFLVPRPPFFAKDSVRFDSTALSTKRMVDSSRPARLHWNLAPSYRLTSPPSLRVWPPVLTSCLLYLVATLRRSPSSLIFQRCPRPPRLV